MVFSISFPKHLEQQINEYCKRNQISEVDMICLAIENLLVLEKSKPNFSKQEKNSFDSDSS